jgi:sulfide:quinone oxidoreductase
MPSATIGRAVANNITSLIKGDSQKRVEASMADMGAACVASAGANPFTGTAASMTVFPIVPDFERYPEYGRDLNYTFGEIGLAGHWIKILLQQLVVSRRALKEQHACSLSHR